MDSDSPSSHRLQRRSLVLARTLVIGLALGYLALWLASVPAFYRHVSTLTIEAYSLGERIIFDNDIAQQRAIDRGMSLPIYAGYVITYHLLQVLVYYTITATLLWRATSRFGWFTALVLTLLPTNVLQEVIGVAHLFPAANVLIELPGYLIWPFWVLWLCLFPNGRVVPHWARLPLGIMFGAFLVLQIASILAVRGFLPPWIDTIAASFGPLLTLPLFGLVLFSHIYRYRRMSTALERQQTKWFLFGVAVLFAGIMLFAFTPSSFTAAYAQEISSVVLLVLPLSVAIAILRYRLWDIDVLIRRTLIFSMLTIILGAIYWGSIVVLQTFLRPFVSTNSQLATVASTLAIAALFQPLRHSIQRLIDRRFFRRKYDAAKTLATFGARLRDETELQTLTGDLLGVVHETMQPAHVSLWLREVPRDT